jgi:hypothetical protein
MPTRKTILVGTALVAGAVLWYLFRPDALIIDRNVNESFPAAARAAPAMAASPAMGQSSAMGQTAMGADEPEPVKLVSGRFHSNAHETKGLATVYRLEDGRRVLRLTAFATSNGPDVRVYLVAADDVQHEDQAKQAGIIDLGALKGNVGDQNYDLPVDLDLSRYRAVSVWCRRFSVNFGAAPLAATPS